MTGVGPTTGGRMSGCDYDGRLYKYLPTRRWMLDSIDIYLQRASREGETFGVICVSHYTAVLLERSSYILGSIVISY